MATLKAMLNQIKTTLLAAAWTGGSTKIFGTGSVMVTRYLPDEILKTTRVPGAAIMPGADQSDPQFDEEPDLICTEVVVRVYVNIPGDAIGENPILGGNRPLPTKSEGAGLLDVIEELYRAIGRMNIADGSNFAIQFRRKGGSPGVHMVEKVRWEYQDVIFEAWHTAN